MLVRSESETNPAETVGKTAEQTDRHPIISPCWSIRASDGTGEAHTLVAHKNHLLAPPSMLTKKLEKRKCLIRGKFQESSSSACECVSSAAVGCCSTSPEPCAHFSRKAVGKRAVTHNQCALKTLLEKDAAGPAATT